MNIMAVTYSAKATITLESQSNYESCQIIIGESNELAAGLNNGEYAEINMDGRSVALYVEYNGVKYQHFASNPATMKNLTLKAKTNTATNYNLIISDVTGAFTLKLGDAEPVVIAAGTTVISLNANQEYAIGVINYDPDALKYDITLNGYYLSTFSAPENVIIPDDLYAYTAEFQGEQGYLLVHKITTGYIPANTGVILFNPEGGKTSTQYDFSLVKYAGDVPALSLANDLKPASAWVYPFEGTVYVLHDSEMWLYNGANMKDNKAYLHVQVGSAPQRIRMVFSEEQGIESIAAEGKAVKFVENGRVFIKRGEKVYNLQGQLVK